MKWMALMVLVACNQKTEFDPDKYLRDHQPKEVNGRFKLHTYSQFPNRGLLIDTATGKIWAYTCITKEKSSECIKYSWVQEEVL